MNSDSKKIFFMFIREPQFFKVCAGFCFFTVNFFIIFNVNLYSQSSGAYLIPRQIYVGDPASFILPLPAAQTGENIILTKNDLLSDGSGFPYDENIDFHRVILERRLTESRLIIEFTAFAAGVLEFPAIEIGGEVYSGISVTVNSLINERSDRYLSGTAATLAMPGTAFLLYGSMAAVAAVILLSIWFVFKGRTVLGGLYVKWKRYRLFSGIHNTEKRLQKALAKGTEKRLILDELSGETRDFLSVLTGENCRAMTAREFESFPYLLNENSAAVNFSNFFKVCDDLRFSGADISSQDVLLLLSDMLRYADELNKSKAVKNTKEEYKE